jgi:hypothetical protein
LSTFFRLLKTPIAAPVAARDWTGTCDGLFFQSTARDHVEKASALERLRMEGAEAARKDLGRNRSRPSWRESRHALPFSDLSDDEFEIFSYLLLLEEHPGERIVYYGKRGDRGRDIVRTEAGGHVELIQCKRYTRNLGVGEVREELAKLCVNIFDKKIPVAPNRVVFYATPDLTSDAKDLIDQQEKWLECCDAELGAHLGKKPSDELLSFARSWWPELSHEDDHRLTRRANRFRALIEEFFQLRPIVTGDISEVAGPLGRIETKIDLLREVDSTEARLQAALDREKQQLVAVAEASGQAKVIAHLNPNAA